MIFFGGEVKGGKLALASACGVRIEMNGRVYGLWQRICLPPWKQLQEAKVDYPIEV